MPVKKKRKSSSSDDSGKKKCKIASFPRPHAPIRLIHLDDQFSSKKCLSWFYEYAGPDKVLGPEDMEKFCEDISVEPENDKDQRTLDMNTAKSMLTLLLGRTWPLFPVFLQFLEQLRYKVMNKDQWYNIQRTIGTDLRNYDEDGACPVLLDEFVEWQNSRMAK